MQNNSFIAVLAACALLGSNPAFAASSDWAEVEGGAVRIVVSASPDEDGRLRGALQVELEPGWKTYWADPGDAGVPPSVSMSVDGMPAEIGIGFPRPGRHDDGYSVWAGYDRPVSFALTMVPPRSGAPMEFSVFLGVCETICIPVQATFVVEPDRSAADPQDEAIVREAFAALPEPARPGFRAVAARIEGSSVLVEVEVPDGDATDLYLASTPNRMFGTPTRQDRQAAFRVPLLSATSGPAEEARYTLVSGEEAVAGTIVVGE